MIFPNVAPVEVANNHIDNIINMFGSTGEGVTYWNSLSEHTRLTLCQFSELDLNLATQSITRFSSRELRRLKQGCERLEKLTHRLNSISLSDFK